MHRSRRSTLPPRRYQSEQEPPAPAKEKIKISVQSISEDDLDIIPPTQYTTVVSAQVHNVEEQGPIDIELAQESPRPQALQTQQANLPLDSVQASFLSAVPPAAMSAVSDLLKNIISAMAAASPGPSVTPAVFPPDPSSQDPDPALTTPSRHRPFTPLIEAPHVATRGPQPGRNMAPVTAPQPSTPGLAPGRTIPEAHAIPGPMLLPPGPSDLLRQPRGPGPTSGVNAMLVTSPEADIGTSGLADSRAVTRTSAPGATPLAGEHREPSLAVGGLSVGGQRGINSASKLRKRTAHLNVNPQGHQRGRSIIRGSTRQIASDRGRGTRRVNPSRAMRPLQFIQMGDNANAVQQAAPDVINPHRADSGLVQAAAQPHDIVSNNSLHVNQGNVQSMHVNQNIEHHLPSHHLPSPIGVNAALNGVNVQAAPQGYNTPLVGIHNANVQSLSQLQHPIMLGIQGVQPLDQGIHSPIAATQGAHAHSLNHAQSISQACHNPIVDQQGVNAQTSANGQSVSQGFHTPLHIAHPPLATDNPDTSIGQSARQILSLLQGAIGSQSAAKTRTNTATVMSGADAEVPSSITAGAAATTSTAQQGSSGLALQNQPAGQPVSSMGQGPPAISHGTTPGVKRIWIVGHSFVHWASLRCASLPFGQSLGLPTNKASVRWLGDRGMCWPQLAGTISEALVRWGKPHIIILHLGGNDVGAIPVLQLIKVMQADIGWLRVRIPGVMIGWSHIIPRLHWRHMSAHTAAYRVRKKINASVAKTVTGSGGFVVRHEAISADRTELYRRDKVHLSDVGLDLFIGDIQRALLPLL
ncbi:mucin-17-like isoform X1 [Bombina bombina]|uniref:mucin-17-like isoform X1 n=2 Tax=Bombina bombina TaxID=8345 RepID=UPI00235A83E0|nr:mucin-17-like isoform X1 [Bombina bombina]